LLFKREILYILIIEPVPFLLISFKKGEMFMQLITIPLKANEGNHFKQTIIHKVDERKSLKILTGDENATISQALKRFEELQTKTKRIVEARNLLVMSFMLKKISTDKYFDLREIIPYKYVCKKCNGAGIMAKFFQSTLKLPCKKCNGVGQRNGKKCLTCNATGIFSKTKTEPVIYNNNKCDKCKGEGYFRELDNPVLERELADHIVTK